MNLRFILEKTLQEPAHITEPRLFTGSAQGVRVSTDIGGIMQTRKGLGKGLDSLLPPPTVIKIAGSSINTLPIDRIAPNRLQPRTVFDEEKIRELASSISTDGILQPLVVSPLKDGRYELIAGERRLRASKLVGLAEVPVVIKNVDQSTVLALSLIENIQREDLNPIEESMAYNELMKNFGMTQDEVAKRVGKSRVAVANSLRLLKLPQKIKDDVSSGRYSAGHARAMLATDSIHEQLKLREWIIKTTPSVRMVEEKISNTKTRTFKAKDPLSAQTVSILKKMSESIGTKVKIKANRKGGGKLIIDYYSWQDLDRIYHKLTNG